MKKRSIKSLISIGAALTLTALITISSFADSVVMGSDGIRIRSSASTSAAVVTTGASGDEYKIVETVSGDDGNTWYKIQVDGSTTGYVRGDLVKVKKDETAEANAADETPNTASSLAPTEPTAITPATATIGGNSSVNIRSGAGVGYEKVGSIDAGTSITLIGEANDSSGNKWYQFKCDSQGIEGYIRSDLITITQEIAPAEGENPEGVEGENPEAMEETTEVVEPEPEVTEPQGGDYEIKYETDSDGVYQYYLYDYPNGNRQKVVELLEAVNTLNTRYQDASAKLTTFKIITILFGVLAVLAIGAAVIFFIKSRNAGEVEYYEDDFEYDDYNDKPKTKRRRQEEEIEEDYPKPQSKKLPNEYAEDQRTSSKDGGRALRNESRRSYTEERAPKSAPSRNHDERRGSSYDERPARRPRKPQNFLADDDEFEFEFLNMDDKDM